MFSLICVWIKGWVNNREAGDLRRYRDHYDVIVMFESMPADTINCSDICRYTDKLILYTTEIQIDSNINLQQFMWLDFIKIEIPNCSFS